MEPICSCILVTNIMGSGGRSRKLLELSYDRKDFGGWSEGVACPVMGGSPDLLTRTSILHE